MARSASAVRRSIPAFGFAAVRVLYHWLAHLLLLHEAITHDLVNGGASKAGDNRLAVSQSRIGWSYIYLLTALIVTRLS
jgi:hypothetical protein